MTIEPPFFGEQFKEALALFEQHRKEIRKKLTPTARSLLYKKFTAWGEARATAAMLYSIENGWTGVFEPKESGNGNGTYVMSKGERSQETVRRMIERTERAH
jgi:hypothetical protein